MSQHFANFLTLLRNAGKAKHRYVDVRTNRLIWEVIRILEREGFIDRFGERRDGAIDKARIFLRYDEVKQPYIQVARCVSTPGRRKYVGRGAIHPVLGGLGIAVISTSKGVMTGREAWRQNVGGELLCHVHS